MKDIIVARKENTDEIWIGNGLFRRHVEDSVELAGLLHWIGQKGGDIVVHDFADLRVLGVDISTLHGDVTVDAVAVVTQLAERLNTLSFVARS